MKRTLKIIIPIAFILFLVFVAFQFGFVDLRKFPERAGLKQVVLNCDYRGNQLTIQEDLYQSIDEYYSSDPKKKFMGYDSYVSSAQEDNTISELTDKIEKVGNELGLTDDETIDLATCFVQNIPYDSEKAEVILSSSVEDRVARATNKEYFDRFPYETLYDNKGICTDKTYLEVIILKEMGYGTAILTFDKEKHMAAGVKTPTGYTTFSTDYSYIETTNTGYMVGQIPTIDESIGRARNTEIENIEESDSGQAVIPELPKSDFSPPSDVIKISSGKEYKRIIDITKNIKRIKELTVLINAKNQELESYQGGLSDSNNSIKNAKNELEKSEERVNEAKRVYNQNPTSENYNTYLEVYDDYKIIYNKTRQAINSYNTKVNELNELINEYNQLIKNG